MSDGVYFALIYGVVFFLFSFCYIIVKAVVEYMNNDDKNYFSIAKWAILANLLFFACIFIFVKA